MTRVNLIQARRDSAARWTFVDPVLALAEFGYEIDTHRMKLGDGSTKWSLLPYLTIASVDGLPGHLAEDQAPADHVHPDSGHEFYGEAAGSATSVVLSSDGGPHTPSYPGVPVAVDSTARSLAVSFMADNVPAGPWIAKLWRRPVGGTFAVAASFSVPVS
jgi:hypothetical protein